MAGSDHPQPKKAIPPKPAASAPRKPLQVMHISRKTEEELLKETTTNKSEQKQSNSDIQTGLKNPKTPVEIVSPSKTYSSGNKQNDSDISSDEQNLSMEDLLKSEFKSNKLDRNNNFSQADQPANNSYKNRVVDDYDFDEDAFLAALDETEPIGNTGEIAKGSVIGVESDGIYVDIGGKAPGFMPKKECGLGVITNLKERFPKGLEVEVLVTSEQNADGMVTISCRALALRQSWEKVQKLEKEGQVVQVKVNGFNRGGVTCDLEGLRAFIPRSQLEEGENHQSLVGKTIGTAFLEVNPERRKLVLSEKKAATAKRFSQLEIGQLVEGKVSSIKPYGFFIDLSGVSGLLHHSMVTNGSIRSLREIFDIGESIKALITDLDPGRGRIGLNTALLEGPPGELITDKQKIMEEAEERAVRARNTLNQEKITKKDILNEEKENNSTETEIKES